MEDIEELRTRWNLLYKDILPRLAKERDPVQPHWPVHLDHCFARIVLDSAVGVDRPWAEVVKQPAVKNMSIAQLQGAIELAEQIATGEQDLDALNKRSLQLRGRKRKGDESVSERTTVKKKKQKQDPQTISSYFLPAPSSPLDDKTGPVPTNLPPSDEGVLMATRQTLADNMTAPLHQIAGSNLTPFRKQTLTLLCQIPPGRYSTYQALSDHITQTSHKTCARAVGNAMRNNPFAPQVPCHRILAADGTLGGFGGHWGEQGKFASKKHELLFGEGVRFDSRGKVRGMPFRDFYG